MRGVVGRLAEPPAGLRMPGRRPNRLDVALSRALSASQGPLGSTHTRARSQIASGSPDGLSISRSTRGPAAASRLDASDSSIAAIQRNKSSLTSIKSRSRRVCVEERQDVIELRPVVVVQDEERRERLLQVSGGLGQLVSFAEQQPEPETVGRLKQSIGFVPDAIDPLGQLRFLAGDCALISSRSGPDIELAGACPSTGCRDGGRSLSSGQIAPGVQSSAIGEIGRRRRSALWRRDNHLSSDDSDTLVVLLLGRARSPWIVRSEAEQRRPATTVTASRMATADGEPASPAAEPAGRAAGPGLARVAKRQVVGDGLEVGGQLGGRLIAVERLGLQAAPDHGFERGGDFGVSIAQPRQRAQPIVGGPQQGLDDRTTAAGRGEGTLAGDGLVEHDAQAVDVGAAVDARRTIASARALRCSGAM